MLNGLQPPLHFKRMNNMNRFATLLLGSALTALIANYGFAADAAPEASKPAATSQPAPAAATAPAATATPAPAEPQSQPAASLKDIKVGYINMAKVAADSAGGKAAAATLKAKSEKLRTKIEAKQKQIEKQKAAIEAKLETMTPKERAAKGSEFQKKMEDYQKLVRSSEAEMQELQDKLTGELFKSIKKAAAEYAKANGYIALVEEKGAFYLADSINSKDLTEEITELLNKKQPAK